MGIFINTGQSSRQALEKASRTLTELNEKLSTGKRVPKAKFDAAASAMIEGFTSQINELSKSLENVSTGESLMAASEGAAAEIGEILQRQRELAMQASNGLLAPQDRQAINEEFTALSEEVNRIANETSFNGHSLLNGQGAGSGQMSIALNGDGSALALSRKDLRTSALQTDDISLATQEGAADALDKLDSAIHSTTQIRSEIGSQSNQLSAARANLESQRLAQEQSRSQLSDLDYAQAITEQRRLQVQSDIALKVLQDENNSNQALLSGLLR